MALSGEDSFTEFGVPVLCDVHRATCLRKLDLLLVEYFVGHGLPDSPLQVNTFFLLSSPGLLPALLHCFYSSGIFAAFKPFTASEQMSVEIRWFSCFISAGALVHCSSTGLKFCECKQVV